MAGGTRRDDLRELERGDVKAVVALRRPEDPAVLVSDAREARQALGWEPRHAALEDSDRGRMALALRALRPVRNG